MDKFKPYTKDLDERPETPDKMALSRVHFIDCYGLKRSIKGFGGLEKRNPS
ncbi:MAG: hypothetical protein AAGB24_11890 [Bacteroidota bacterium]